MIVQIPFQQLLENIKRLTATQKSNFKKRVGRRKKEKDDKKAYIAMLLNRPVFTDKKIKKIKCNRKSMAKWLSDY